MYSENSEIVLRLDSSSKYTPQNNSRTSIYVFPLFNIVSYTFKIKNIFLRSMAL